MPARVALAQSFANLTNQAACEDDGAALPLDLEAKLQRAAGKVLSNADVDLLEAVACQACEALESFEQCADGAEEALREVLEPLLTEADLSARLADLLSALLAAAELSGASKAALPSMLKLPSLLPLRGASKAVSSTGVAAQDAGTPEEHQQEAGFRRRGDVERERAAAYLQEHTAQALREKEEAQIRVSELANFSRWPVKVLSQNEATESIAHGVLGPAPQPAASSDSEEDSEGEDEATIRDRESTKRRLRELGEPATFFGEDDSERWTRLQRLELKVDQDILASGSTNVMQILDRKEKRKAEAAGGIEGGLDVVDAEDAEFEASERKSMRTGADEHDSDSDAEGMIGAALAEEGEDQDPEALEAQEQLDAASHSVMSWIRSMLRSWEESLTQRAPKEEKLASFKAEKAQYRQSKQYLKPLRRSLRDGEVEPGIIFSLAKIAEHCSKRHYKSANEAYMRLAIGNQAWPMGVTMITFHDRPNRHGIGEGKTAHVLDDETTRKYVQMVKRLVTFAEQHWPVDPSMAE